MVTRRKQQPAFLSEQRSSLQRKETQNRGRPSLPAPGIDEGVNVPTITEAMRSLYGSGGVISRTKPVTGRDLNILRTRLGGLTVTDACFLFGLQRNRWYQLSKSDEPLEDVTLALFARVLDAYPELCPIKPAPRADWMFHWLKQVDPMLDQRRFSLLLGREKSAAHRWLKLGTSVSPKVERMFNVIQTMLLTGMHPQDSIEPLVLTEAAARNIDITKEGIWSKPDARFKPKRRKAGERDEEVQEPAKAPAKAAAKKGAKKATAEA